MDGFHTLNMQLLVLSAASAGAATKLTQRKQKAADYVKKSPKKTDSKQELRSLLGDTRVGILKVDYSYEATRGDVDSEKTFPLMDTVPQTVESWTFEAAQRGVVDGVWPAAEFRLVKADGSADAYWQKNWDAVSGRSCYYQVKHKLEDGYFDKADYKKGQVMRYPSKIANRFMKRAVKYMEQQSATAIAADVGFSMQFQDYIAPMTAAPVGLSSLIQLSWIMNMHGKKDMLDRNQVIMVLTANGTSFNNGIQGLLPSDVPNQVVYVVGLEDTNFGQWVGEGASFVRFDKDDEDVATVEESMLGICEKVSDEMEALEKKGSEVVAILSECTELPAYTNILR